jgi:multiple sugar transport system substrate-binding protein
MTCVRWLVLVVVGLSGCGRAPEGLTFSGSVLGAEGAALRHQIERFASLNPELPVAIRVTPDSADARHQLYVQWLNAWSPEPDVLQLDVIWTPEFAAAGWILPLDRFAPDTGDFFAATLAANRWQGRLFAIPWLVDVGMLYWRTDLLAAPPSTFAELTAAAHAQLVAGAVSQGLVWQGARYEGLVCVFLEHLVAFGGRILDDRGAVVVDSPEAVRALTFMLQSIADGVVPRTVLTWQEEQTRFAFQNGGALFMRNVSLVSPGGGALDGIVEVVAPLGHATIVHVRTEDAHIVAAASGETGARPGEKVGLKFAASRLHVFTTDGRRLET